MGKMSVLVLAAIATVMTLSMHDKVLAVGSSGSGEPGYQLTVTVPSHPFGTSTVGISITTANGYTDQANPSTSSGASWTFNIPPNQGNSVLVCVNSENSSQQTCHTYSTTGTDMSVSLSPASNNVDQSVILIAVPVAVILMTIVGGTTETAIEDSMGTTGSGNRGFGGFNGHHMGRQSRIRWIQWAPIVR